MYHSVIEVASKAPEDTHKLSERVRTHNSIYALGFEVPLWTNVRQFWLVTFCSHKDHSIERPIVEDALILPQPKLGIKMLYP